jgi:hypothetical protein
VFTTDAEPNTENEPVTIKLPPIFKVVPSNVKFDSATAALTVPSEVNILLSPGLEMVLKPVPLEPEVPLEPDEPLVPEDPEVPEVPLEPTGAGITCQ